MMFNLSLRRIALSLWLTTFGISSSALAQMTVELSGSGAQQIPIAVLGFAGDAAADEVTQIIRNDLSRLGLFRMIDAGNAKFSETQTPALADLRRAGADAVAWGAVYKTADGRLDVRLRLWDTVRNVALDNASITAAGIVRTAGHQTADRIYEKMTGHKGFFTSRLAYVSRISRDQFELRVADWDGQFSQTALRSREPIISPTWSPDGSKLAYVSFENRKANVIVHDLATGARTVAANFRGSNSAPAFAPDGRSLVAATSQTGLAQLYRFDLNGANARRITQSGGIDTEPAFSPDGASIYFVSDRSGSPQIFRLNANAYASADATRVSFKGSYNISPSVSPDGKQLAFVSLRDGRFTTVVMDLATQNELVLSDTARDESPTFSPNGRFVMYATEVRGKGVLVLAATDGRVKSILSSNAGDVREPAWSYK